MFSYGLIFFFVYSLVLSRIPVYADGDKFYLLFWLVVEMLLS